MIGNFIKVRDILRAVNIILLILFFFAYKTSHAHPFIDEATIFLGTLLVLQTFIFLSFQKSEKNPFILLFSYLVTVYYSFRILTLTFYQHSDVFNRFPYYPSDSNQALIFIILSNFALFLGFYTFQDNRILDIKRNHFLGISNDKNSKNLIVIVWIIVCTFLMFTHQLLKDLSIFFSHRLGSILLTYTSTFTFFFPLLIFIFLYRKSINKYYIYSIFLLLLFNEFLSITQTGSRGNLVYLLEWVMIFGLLFDKFSISKKIFNLSFLFMPLLFCLAVILFLFGNLTRSSINETQDQQIISRHYNNIVVLLESSRKEFNEANIASRVGFFDFSAEIIAHKKNYESIFTFSNYYKSIVDNVLTPGFDIYDTPKVSLSLLYKYKPHVQDNIITKSYITHRGIYNSDQISLYAEAQALFGWYSLLFFYLFACFLSWIYFKKGNNSNELSSMLIRGLTLLFFVRLFNSFGFDWTLAELLPYLLISSIFLFFANRAHVIRLISR